MNTKRHRVSKFGRDCVRVHAVHLQMTGTADAPLSLLNRKGAGAQVPVDCAFATLIAVVDGCLPHTPP